MAMLLLHMLLPCGVAGRHCLLAIPGIRAQQSCMSVASCLIKRKVSYSPHEGVPGPVADARPWGDPDRLQSPEKLSGSARGERNGDATPLAAGDRSVAPAMRITAC